VDPPAPDARLAAALSLVVRDYGGRVAAGVTDQATGVTAVYHGTESFTTASIVKADILAVLLLQRQRAGASLGAASRQLAARMIKDSDNAAASALWRAVGAGPGLDAGNAVLGLEQTVPGPGGYWGLTTTTVADQLRLLAVLTSARSPLSAAARGYELGLMRDVEAGQDWGVTRAASAGTRPAVKNGWLPTGPRGLWVINSIGVISHAGHKLALAVLSAGNPSQSAGISLVQAAATTVAGAVAAAGSPGPAGSHRVRDTCAPARNGLRA
jgi:beta-lactamase family protein